MNIQKHFPALLLVTVILGVTFGAAAASRVNQDAAPLFLETNQIQQLNEANLRAATRSRFATINFASLERARLGGRLLLNLFDDLALTAVIDENYLQGEATIWVGHIEGEAMAQLFLVASGGQIAAQISSPSGIYEVRYAGDGVHVISQIDQSLYPEEAPPIEVNAPAAQINPSETFPSAPDAVEDDGSVIDVLVVYTPAARNAAGGVTAIQNLINLAIAQTNTSYANSNIRQRLNLVYVGEIAYTESGSMETDLERLRRSDDSYMNSVHSLRNTYYADLVNLIEVSAQYCGIAHHMNSVGSYFKDWAFSVVAHDCATGYYSLAHELGHNMGARHDWFVDVGVTPYSYAHGYVNAVARFRTIMSYTNECTARGVICTRLQYWANPALYYNGQPMGVPGGTNTSCRLSDVNHPPCDADDHRTLNNTAYTVANFRVRPVTGTPTPTPTRTRTPTPTATPRPFWLWPYNSFLPSVRK